MNYSLHLFLLINKISRPVYCRAVSLPSFQILQVTGINKEQRDYILTSESAEMVPDRDTSVDQRSSAQRTGSWGFLSGINLQEKWSSRSPIFSAGGVKHQGKSRYPKSRGERDGRHTFFLTFISIPQQLYP